MKSRIWLRIALSGLLCALGLAIASKYITPERILASRAVAYFEAPSAQGIEFLELGHNVYAYQHLIDIGLIVRTKEGLVVIESFDTHYVEGLKDQLDKRFPGEPITHLIYSHHHLDHVRGAHELKPLEVLAHENTRWHFERTPEEVALRPTQYLPAGDRTLDIGGRRIELLDFDHGHAQHLWGFYLADADLFYAPDLAFCKTLPPFGFPDFNHNGHVEALERAEKLDFKTFVPSHFELGGKECISENLALYRDIRRVMNEGIEAHGLPVGQGSDWFVTMIEAGDNELSRKYGHWHGYKEMGTPFLLRQISGSFLGF